MFEEDSSGVRNPSFGKIGRRLILAKRWLYIEEYYGKKIKSASNGALEGISFLYNHLLSVSNTSASIHPKLGVPAPLERSLNIINCPEWGKTPYQT